MEEKVLSLEKLSAVAIGSRGALPPFWFTKILFWNIMERQGNQQKCKTI